MAQYKQDMADKIIRFVDDFYVKYLRAPSLREIEKYVNVSRQTVMKYLKMLDDEGTITYDGQQGILKTKFMSELTGGTIVKLPVLGRITCSSPEGNVQEQLGVFEFPRTMIGNGEHFVLIASGNSMIGAGITDGDYVIIKKQSDARVGDIVAVMDDSGDTTLKTLKFDNEKFTPYLHPENKTYEDIYPKEINIQGVAVKVIKNL